MYLIFLEVLNWNVCVDNLYLKCVCWSLRLKCVCWNCTCNVCVETEPEMCVLKLYLKCVCWNFTWNVRVEIALEMCVLKLHLKCACWNCIWNVHVETVLEMRTLKLYLKCVCWNCTFNVSVNKLTQSLRNSKKHTRYMSSNHTHRNIFMDRARNMFSLRKNEHQNQQPNAPGVATDAYGGRSKFIKTNGREWALTFHLQSYVLIFFWFFRVRLLWHVCVLKQRLNVCVETVPEMRLLKLYLKCVSWNCVLFLSSSLYYFSFCKFASHRYVRYSFNKRISGTVSTNTFQVQFQHTHSSAVLTHTHNTTHKQKHQGNNGHRPILAT